MDVEAFLAVSFVAGLVALLLMWLRNTYVLNKDDDDEEKVQQQEKKEQAQFKMYA